MRIVHSRPRYIVGWMPRVKGNSPGAPRPSYPFLLMRSSGVYWPFTGLLHVLPGLRRGVEDRALVRGEHGRCVLRVDLAAVREIRLVPEGIHRAGTDGIPDPINPLRQVAERLGAGHVEHRQNALRALEVRLLEKLQERSLAHDVQDHHVDLDRPTLHRTQGDRLLRDDRAERPDI